jgi:hypothetical protein
MIHRRGSGCPELRRGLLGNHFSKRVRAAKEFCTVEFDGAFPNCREVFLKSRFFCNPLQIVCILDSVARTVFRSFALHGQESARLLPSYH